MTTSTKNPAEYAKKTADGASRKSPRTVLVGVPSSPGFAMGTVFPIANREFSVVEETLPESRLAAEEQMFLKAVTKTAKEIAQIKEISESRAGVKEPIDGLFAGTDKVMGNANQLISELEGVTKHLDGLIAKVQAKMDSKDNTVGILLNDRTLHDDLVKTVHSADSLFRIILQDGLDINVDFF